MVGKNKENVVESINKNIWLFLLMLIGISMMVLLFSKFYHWDRIGGIYVPFAFTTDGIFSNNWMFISSTIYGLFGTGMIIYLFKDKFIKDNKKRTNKWYYKAIVGVTLGLYGLFYITNPWYTLQTHPRLFMYQDGNNITNKTIYFYLTEKYGFDETLYKPFKTLDDSIAGLEFSKKLDDKLMYYKIFYDLQKFGYDKVLEQYKDITFQAYFLRTILGTNYLDDEKLKFFNRNIFLLKNLEKISSNELIKKISSKALNEYVLFIKTNNNINELIKNFREGLLKDSWEVKGVNEGVFFY